MGRKDEVMKGTGKLFTFLATVGIFLSLPLTPLSPTVQTRIERSLANTTAAPQAPVKQVSPENSEPLKRQALETYGKLPLSFEANWGQTDAQVKFLSRGSGYTLFLTGTEAVLSLRQNEESNQRGRKNQITQDRLLQTPARSKSSVLRMSLIGANPAAEVSGLEKLPGKSNYFVGNDPEKWHANLPHYARVHYQNVYPGIDLAYYGKQRQLEYDFIVKPGADPNQIRLGFDGAKEIWIDENGDLVLTTEGGDVRQHKPVIYQEVAGSREEVAGSYVVKANGEVGFEIGAYDRSQPLVIDPVLSYSTYLGGDSYDLGYGIAVDSAGNAYVTGWTTSSDFPTPNAFQASYSGTNDVFVTKLTASGGLSYSTYLLGDGGDYGQGIAVDAAGNAYVTGLTTSSNFPTLNAFQANYGGDQDVFVTKLTASGELSYSTYLGGNSPDLGYGIAVDSTGNACVTGQTGSTNFPILNAFQASFGGTQDVFVTKLTASGGLSYSTYLGGNDLNFGYGIAVDSAGNAYVTGYTYSANFPILNAFQASFGGGIDAFVTKLTAGGGLSYSTYLGGAGGDFGQGIAVDLTGNVYVTGQTNSTDFPTLNAFQSSHAIDDGKVDAFVTKILDQPASEAEIFYLHGTGPNSNPPALFLNNAAPTATTAKFKDSPAVNFSGGNPWKEVGTWPAASALTAGTLTALSDLHVWLGLKNSDDQGTRFDLRAEVYKNDALVVSGEVYCIEGITRNPNLAKEVIVAFAPFSPVVFNGTTDELSLKVLTRIGTNGAGGFCGGHSNAVGLRLYFDADSRPARFGTMTSP
jgi:hypothetical protein